MSNCGIKTNGQVNGIPSRKQIKAIQYIIGQLSLPVEQTANFMRNLQDMRIGLTRINEIHHLPDEDSNFMPEAHSSKVINGDLVLKNLSFQYPGTSKEVLSNVNITIPAGKITAIVGESGSGKSNVTTLSTVEIEEYTKSPDGQIYPDIEIPYVASEYMQGGDPLLEKLIKYIQGQKR